MGTVAKIKYGNTTHLVASTCYGTCSTAAATVAKVATIQDSQAFSLINGITIHIKFTYSNTATSPTLNVNDTGAKAIKMYGTTATGKTATASWHDGSVVSFTYDGTNWIQNDYKADTNTTYSAGTGLSLSSTTFNHSNSVDAQTIQKVYPIKIDAQGHISAYGTSPTTLSGYGITDAVLKSGDTMTGDLTIKVTSTYDDNSPSKLTLQTVDSTNSATSTGVIYAFDGGANGANFVVRPGGNLFLGSGKAAYNHYAAAYTHSTGETTFITSDGVIHIQANGQTIANRVGAQIDTSGNLVPDKADVATNNIGGIGTSTYKWANGYFTKINGVTVGDSPEFTDTTYTGAGLITVNASTHVISTTAEANQNAFSTVKVGSTNVSADTATDTLTLAGSNVTLTPDATNDKVTIGITSSNVTTALGYTPYSNTNPDGYTSNTGTITRVKTTAGVHSTINVSSGAAEFNVPTTPNHLLAFDAGTAGIALTADDNVDTLDVGKTYYSASSSVSATLAGTPPTTSSGFKIVTCKNYSGNNYLFQFAIKYMGRDKTTSPFTDMGNIFVRHKYRDASNYPWSAWYKFYTSENLLSEDAENAGTAVSLVTTGEKYTWNNKPSLGETSSTAYRGDRGKTAYDHSQVTSGNPHNVTKSDVGLGNVGNFKAVSTVASQGLTTTEKSNARTNIGAGTGTVTKVSTGAGLVGGDIQTTGTIKCALKSETVSTLASASITSTSSRQYAVNLDKNSVLSVNVPWSNTYTSAYCSTAGDTAAKVGTCTNYKLLNKSWLHVTLVNENSVQGAITLNVNSTGAKAIYINGKASSSSNHILPAGTYLVHYTDSKYYFRTDGALNNGATAPTYTLEQTSPGYAWAPQGILATRVGNVVQIVVKLEGFDSTTVLPGGQDGFAGRITCTEGFMPSRPITLMGYIGDAVLMGWFEKTNSTTGTITVRANKGTQIAVGNTLWLTGTFLTDTIAY